jgi:thioredoxin-related protein
MTSVAIWLAASALSAQDGAIRYAESVEAAVKAARDKGRAALIYFTQKGCPYCAKIERESLSTKVAADLANASFECATASIQEKKAQAARYQVRMTPTLVLVDGDGEFLGALHGYFERQDVMLWLRAAADASRLLGAARKGGKPEECASLADALSRMFEDGGAIEWYERALRASATSAASAKRFRGETLARKGFCHYRRGDDPAILRKISDELLELDPDGKLGVHDNALLLRALYGGSGGEGVDIRASVDEAIRRFPDSEVMDGLLYCRAQVVWQMDGDAAAAKKILEEIQTRFPNSPFRLSVRADLKQLGEGK